MTQDVQPLTWQKRTNLEEHQQFFSKINEIIANLAPTVDEAEQAIAQATQAIADANAAIATANAASAAASAAASQAQTAATTVAGYDTRLTAAEGDIDALQAADQTITGNVAALGTRMTAAESKNTQQDTAIAAVQTKNNQQDSAISALQTADAQNVKVNTLPSLAVMLTDNQDVYGNKTSYGHIINVSAGFDMPSQTNRVVGDGWVKMYESIGSNHPVGIFVIMPRREAAVPGFGIIACGGHHIGTVMCKWLSKDYIVASYQSSIMVTVEQDLVTIWAKNINTTDNVQMRDIGTGYNGYAPADNTGFHPSTDKTVYTMTEEDGQIVGYTDSRAIDHTFITYEISR